MNKPVAVSGTLCQLCGREVNPDYCEDGYTNCCNELIVYGGWLVKSESETILFEYEDEAEAYIKEMAT